MYELDRSEKDKPKDYQHFYECAGCRQMKDKSGVKMCAGCKTMGYCSRECQKTDWKAHKALCVARPERNRTLALIEKVFQKSQNMEIELSLLLVVCLELHKHPERVDTHAVALHCETPLVRESMAYRLCSEFDIFGKETSVTRDVGGNGERLLELVNAAPIPNKSVPPGLDVAADTLRKRIQSASPDKPRPRIVRGMWMTKDGGLKTVMITTVVQDDMLAAVTKWELQRRLFPDPRRHENFLLDRIQQFNVGSLTIDERRKMMMITSED